MDERLRNSISNEADLLLGNRNRMCVCDNLQEVDFQFIVAVKRLVKLHQLNTTRLLECENEKGDYMYGCERCL